MKAKSNACLNRTHGRTGWLNAALVCLLLTLPAGSALAAKAADFGKQPIIYGGRTTTFNATGMPLNTGGSTIPVSPSMGGWSQSGNYGFPTAPVGPTAGLDAFGEFIIGGSGSVKYPFKSKSTVSPAAIITGIGTMGCSLFVGGAAAMACSLAVPFVFKWISDAGGRLDPQTQAFQRQDPSVCSANCNWYRWSSGGEVRPASFTDMQSACAALVASLSTWFNPTIAAPYGSDGTATPSSASCKGSRSQSGSLEAVGSVYKGASRPSSPASWLPSSMDDIAPYMTARSFDPRVAGEVLGQGGMIDMPNPVITGPASITGPVTTTTNADGSKTTSSTVSNFTTAGNVVTNTTNVSTSTTLNTDNSVRSTTSTSVAPTDAVPADDPCAKTPDRVGCSTLDTPEEAIPKITKTITYAEENTFGGGSCPADKYWTSTKLHGSFKIVDWGTFCGYALPIRAMVILLALFAAFLIVMPGKETRT